jgi:hypothetical protein
MKEERMHGIKSKNRDRPIEENLQIFNEMKAYTEKVLPKLTSKLTFRAVNSASVQKSPSIAKTRHFATLSYFVAITRPTIEEVQLIKCILHMTLRVQLSIHLKVSHMPCVHLNTKIEMLSMHGC